MSLWFEVEVSRMPGKLKVFQAQFGFYDSVVAAPSQAAALRVWGAHQNLFNDGGAHIATDPQAIEAALAQPEVALRRAAGSADPFTLNPRLPTASDLPDKSRSTPPTKQAKASQPKARPKPTPPPLPPPDRSALDEAEAALAVLERDRQAEEQVFQERRTSLAAEEQAAKARYDQGVSRARETIRREEAAFDREVKRRASSPTK